MSLEILFNIEDYPSRNSKIRDRVGKKVYVPANSNTSIRFVDAILENIK